VYIIHIYSFCKHLWVILIALSTIVTSSVVNTIDFLLLGSGNIPLYFGNSDKTNSISRMPHRFPSMSFVDSWQRGCDLPRERHKCYKDNLKTIGTPLKELDFAPFPENHVARMPLTILRPHVLVLFALSPKLAKRLLYGPQNSGHVTVAVVSESRIGLLCPQDTHHRLWEIHRWRRLTPLYVYVCALPGIVSKWLNLGSCK